MSFQVLAVEEGGRRVMKKVEKILKKRWLSVAGGSRRRDEHILRGMKEGEQGERSNGSERVKGILHQKIFYCLNLIFWIIMGCGIARFGRKGLKTTETWKFWSQILSPGVLRRGAPGVSRRGAMGFRGAAQGFRGAAPWGFEARRHGVSRRGAMGFRGAAPLIKDFSDLSFGAVPRGPIWLPGTSRDGTMRMVLIF